MNHLYFQNSVNSTSSPPCFYFINGKSKSSQPTITISGNTKIWKLTLCRLRCFVSMVTVCQVVSRICPFNWVHILRKKILSLYVLDCISHDACAQRHKPSCWHRFSIGMVYIEIQQFSIKFIMSTWSHLLRIVITINFNKIFHSDFM